MSVVVEFLVFDGAVFAFARVLVLYLLAEELMQLVDAQRNTHWLGVSHTIHVFFLLHGSLFVNKLHSICSHFRFFNLKLHMSLFNPYFIDRLFIYIILRQHLQMQSKEGLGDTLKFFKIEKQSNRTIENCIVNRILFSVYALRFNMNAHY